MPRSLTYPCVVILLMTLYTIIGDATFIAATVVLSYQHLHAND